MWLRFRCCRLLVLFGAAGLLPLAMHLLRFHLAHYYNPALDVHRSQILACNTIASAERAVHGQLPAVVRRKAYSDVDGPSLALLRQFRQRLNVYVVAVSANHFRELMVGLFPALAEHVFPALRNSTTFTFKLLCYDLGMTAKQIGKMTRSGMCTSIIQVPFHKLPESFLDLRTCAWKPLLIQANAPHSQLTVWMDASVRFASSGSSSMATVLRRAAQRGLYVTTSGWMMPQHLARQALRYFGVDPCLLSPFSEMAGGFVAVRNDDVTRSAVLGPWVACAFSPDCLCPGFDCYARLKPCRLARGSSPYSRCHRFDQAALGLIVVYLFDWRATSFYGGLRGTVYFRTFPNRYNMTLAKRPTEQP